MKDYSQNEGIISLRLSRFISQTHHGHYILRAAGVIRKRKYCKSYAFVMCLCLASPLLGTFPLLHLASPTSLTAVNGSSTLPHSRSLGESHTAAARPPLTPSAPGRQAGSKRRYNHRSFHRIIVPRR